MNGEKDNFKNRILDHFFEPVVKEEDKKISDESFTARYKDETELRVEPAVVEEEVSTVKEPTIISAQTVIRDHVVADSDIEISGGSYRGYHC